MGWALWGGLHSLLLHPAWVQMVLRRWPGLCPYYRLLYNCWALLSLVPLVYGKHILAGAPLFVWSGPPALLRYAGLGLALWLGWMGARAYDLAWIGGWTQLRRGCTLAEQCCGGELYTTGILQRVRHPWYGAAMLLLWTHAAAFDAANLATSTVLSVYVLLGAHLEESKLLAIHGDAYHQYRQRVPMFLPWQGSRWS